MRWLEAPPAGTAVCGGFDGSTTNDWTAIKLETVDGLLFTPRYGPDRRPTIWNPADWGGNVPRLEVEAAWSELTATYRFARAYNDPPQWASEIDSWARLYGEDTFLEFATFRVVPMHAALDRFVTDLGTGALKHDGCPITTAHVANARKLARSGERYILGKPSDLQKIDVAMSSVLAHEAASDARADGWSAEVLTSEMICL